MARGVSLCVFIAILCRSVFGEDKCVTYNFEENFEKLFDMTKGPCGSFPNNWNLGSYSTLGMEPLDKRSTKFISPTVSSQMSCVGSFNFNINNGGFIEILVYTENAQNTDQITAMVNTAGHQTLTTIFYNSQSPDYIEGWVPLRIQLLPSSLMEGYVSNLLKFCSIYTCDL